VASFVCFWVDILNGTIKAGDCVLSETDSTSAKGWLYKINFGDFDQTSQMTITRKMAVIVNDAGVVLHAKWLKGKLNTVSYCLYRDHNIPGTDLIHMLRLLVLMQISEDFKIN
jgi:hypothetical protein